MHREEFGGWRSCFCKAANAPGVATSLPKGNSGRRSIAYFMSVPFEGIEVQKNPAVLAPGSG